MNTRLLLMAGIFGALLMFVGDMLLYFTTAPLAESEDALLQVMAGVSKERLFVGGLLGPIAACFYLLGFYGVYQTLTPSHLSKLLFGLLAVAIVVGGAFHSHFTALGIVAQQDVAQAQTLFNYSAPYMLFVVISYAIASLIYGYLALAGLSHSSKWCLLVSPLVLMCLMPLWPLVLPQPLFIIISGGWFNLAWVLFFAALWLSFKDQPHPKMVAL